MKLRLLILVAGDILILLVALYLALLVRFGYHAACNRFFVDNLQVPFILIATVLMVSYLAEIYTPGRNVRKRDLLVNVALASTGSFFTLSAAYYLAPDIMVGRGLLALTIVFFALSQYLWHILFFFGHSHPRFAQSVVVLGFGELAEKIGAMAAETRGYYRVLGFVRCGSLIIGEKEVPRERILGNADSLRDIAQAHQADIIVVALSERRGIFPLRDALSCKLNGIEILDTPSFYLISTNLPPA